MKPGSRVYVFSPTGNHFGYGIVVDQEEGRFDEHDTQKMKDGYVPVHLDHTEYGNYGWMKEYSVMHDYDVEQCGQCDCVVPQDQDHDCKVSLETVNH